MRQALISVIIPAFNVSSFISECIDSVLNQTYNNIEIIVINDGSTDNTLSICTEMQRKNRSIIVLDIDNGGVSRARNIGLNNASGEFVLFLDGDDFLPEKSIENLVSAFKDETVGVVCGAINKCRLNGSIVEMNLWPRYKQMSGSALEFEQAMIEEWLPQFVWNKLYRASLLSNVRFKEGIVSEELLFNYDLYTEMTKRNYQFVAILDRVYCYRENPNSITSLKKIQTLIDITSSLSNLITITEERNQVVLRESAKRQYVGYQIMLNYKLLKENLNQYRDTIYRQQLKHISATEVYKYSNFRNCLFFIVLKYAPRILWYRATYVK